MQDRACLPKRLNPEPERTSLPLGILRHSRLVQQGLVRGHRRGRQSRLGHHACKQHTEQGPRRARQWTNNAGKGMLNPSMDAPGSSQVCPSHGYSSCARRSFLTLLSSQQAPENNIGRTQANCFGTAPNLSLGLPATINITLGVADAHKRRERAHS